MTSCLLGVFFEKHSQCTRSIFYFGLAPVWVVRVCFAKRAKTDLQINQIGESSNTLDHLNLLCVCAHALLGVGLGWEQVTFICADLQSLPFPQITNRGLPCPPEDVVTAAKNQKFTMWVHYLPPVRSWSGVAKLWIMLGLWAHDLWWSWAHDPAMAHSASSRSHSTFQAKFLASNNRS